MPMKVPPVAGLFLLNLLDLMMSTLVPVQPGTRGLFLLILALPIIPKSTNNIAGVALAGLNRLS
jgi:hypothetical protein